MDSSLESSEREPESQEIFTLKDLYKLKEIAMGNGNNREANITVAVEQKENETTQVAKDFQEGQSTRVKHEIAWPNYLGANEFERKIIRFHVHPDVINQEKTSENWTLNKDVYQPGSPLEMLPSIQEHYEQRLVFGSAGDLATTFPHIEEDRKWFSPSLKNRVNGGALNIITKDGVTLLVGCQQLGRDIKTATTIREKLGHEMDEEFKPAWRIIYGSNADSLEKDTSSFTDIIDASNKGLSLLEPKGVAVTRLDYFAGNRRLYFLSISWDELEGVLENEEELHEITFGEKLPDFVARVKEKHNLPDFPVENDLASAIKKPIFPERRGQKSKEVQETISNLLEVKRWQDSDWQELKEVVSSLNEAREIKNGIELRELFEHMGVQLPWPEAISESVNTILEEEDRGCEFLNSLYNILRTEKHAAKNPNYPEQLPDFLYQAVRDKIAEIKKADPEATPENNSYLKYLEYWDMWFQRELKKSEEE